MKPILGLTSITSPLNAAKNLSMVVVEVTSIGFLIIETAGKHAEV